VPTDETLRFFPKSPYDSQREAMADIEAALEAAQDVVFEGACGTGKTLAALAPALAHAREHDKTVVISTNVHQQMRQFVTEAREIRDSEPIRAVVFRGKASMCHIDVGYEECQTLRETTADLLDTEQDLAELEEREAELREAATDGSEQAAEARATVMDELEQVETELETLEAGNTCERYRANLTENTAEFHSWLFDSVRTPDEIYDHAEQLGFCGYELLKDGLEGVDLVVCNYHHLLDPQIRAQFFRWIDRDPEDIVAIFDEAHNVEDGARDHASSTLTESTLERAVAELEGTVDPRATAAQNVVEAFLDALRETYDDALGARDRRQVEASWEDVPIRNETGRDDLTRAFLQAYSGQGIDADLEDAMALGTELDEQYETDYRRGESATRTDCQTLQAAQFIRPWIEDGGNDVRYPVIGVRRNESTEELYGRAELSTTIPRETTAELFESLHASVLMSATIQPFDVFESVLGLDSPARLSHGLTFPQSHRRTFAVASPALFASKRDDLGVLETVTDTLKDVLEFTPGNTLLFFPSYGEAQRYHDRLGSTESTRYLDQPATRAESLRESFVADQNGALFTSLWGTLAEGVSFDGDDARTVVVVGVPYPHLDDRSEAIQQAYAKAFGDSRDDDTGWRHGVEIPTVRKTRQALGRVLRSPDDVAARVLLDERYTSRSTSEMGQYSVHDSFPDAEREALVDVDPEKLKFALRTFFADTGCYDGEPPDPV